MPNFEDKNQVGAGMEQLPSPNVVRALRSGDKLRVLGRPLLRETHQETLYHEAEVVELEVVVYRLFVRPDLGCGHNHLPEEFRRELPVMSAFTADGLAVHYGMTAALGFSAELLG